MDNLSSKPMKVLVVEDESVLRELLIDYFRNDEQFTIVGSACDGEEAMEKCMLLEPDLIVLDIRMPKVNGLEVLKFLSVQKPDTKVVIFSGTLTEDCLRKAAKYKVGGFVGKAYGMKELKHAMETVAGGGRYTTDNVTCFMKDHDPAYAESLSSTF